MRDRNEFRERFKRWKETGESQYENGLIKRLESNLPDDPPVESSIPYPMLTSSDYDDARAWELGFFKKAGAKGHLWSRDDETGRFLKTPVHPTVGRAICGDMREGYDVYQRDGQYYSQPNFSKQRTDRLNPNIRPPMLPGYAEGKPGDPPTPQTTGGAGYVPPLKSYPNIQSVPTVLRNRFYSKIHPDDTYNVKDFVGNFLGTSYRGEQDGDIYYAWKRVFDANDKFYPNDEDNKLNRIKADIGDEMLATYLNIPIKNRHSNIRFTKSKYDNDAYALPLPDLVKQSIIEQTRNNKIGTNVAGLMGIFLGTSSLGRGYDSKGEYRSYGDSYDLNPFKGKWQVANIPMLSDIEDLTLGIGKPFNVYDRIYLNDYYGVPSDTKGLYLPEVIVKPKK